MLAIVLALGSSVGYGVSDFLASRVTKRVAPVLLVLYSQALQSVVLLAVVVAVRQPYSAGGLAWGTASGAIGAAGLVAYYQALATGQTAIGGDDDEADPAFDAVADGVERLAMHPAQIQVLRIRAQCERPLSEVVKLLVHH